MMLKQESAQTPALCPCLCPPLINSIEFVLHVCVVVIGDVDFLSLSLFSHNVRKISSYQSDDTHKYFLFKILLIKPFF